MYRTIAAQSWTQLLAAPQAWSSPLIVHLPIQPVHAPDFVHVDSALNVIRRRVIADASVKDDLGRYDTLETLAVCVAFDDPPFVPDYRYTRLALAEGRYPVVRADYFSPGRDLLYTLDYYCVPVEESRQTLLWICGRVRNEHFLPRQAHVRVKPALAGEHLLADYHYVPFSWDASRWPACTRVTLDGTALHLDGQPFGKVAAGDFALAWEDDYTATPDAYNFGPLYEGFWVPLSHRLLHSTNALHFSTALTPGEEKAFRLALLVNVEAITPAHLDALAAAEAEEDRATARRHFPTALPPTRTRLVCAAEYLGDIFEALQVNTAQLLVRFPDRADLVPTQGGTSERHFVWVGEAVITLDPLLALGHFAPVREALEFIFRLQDGGCPPEGHFTSLEGAVGTTGPRWACTTGMALGLAADYARYTHDDAFLADYLPKLLRAGDWILREIRATRQEGAEVTPTSGLMPLACATDGDFGYVIAWTDAYTYWGLAKCAAMLVALGHPRAAEFHAETARYRADINRALASMRRDDGYIPRLLVTSEADAYTHPKFDTVCGVMHLAVTGAFDIRGETFAHYRDYMETHAVNGPFWGAMDRDIAYMGVAEYAWQEIYLRLGAWKAAFLALQTNLRYGMTADTYQVQERFSKSNPAFTPWQPNASGNSKLLEMLVKAFYFETDGVAILLGCTPFLWLCWNGRTALEDLHTPRGRVTLEAVMLDETRCRLRLTGALPPALRLPDHITLLDGDLTVPPGATMWEGIIGEGEK